ncbi:S-layer protein [Lactobacillus sp. HBUAS51381]|uniref:S-layer protein n=1 Tax=Lactobacillus sp. HBUAS51381 TaxID=2722743 RepID=UPI0014577D1B|nr:S-layer protein [Lactobacillus sp. HBUAS51381]NLR10644.1 S-layer protein [Lactobacillus sp. HBUAS51381]
MQSSLKKSLYLGLAALSFVSVAAVSTTASAKSAAKVTSDKVMTSDATTRNINLTGKNAIYSKPGTVKGAKVIATTTTAKNLKNSTTSHKNFRAYRVAKTNRGSIYYKVVSYDKAYRGWVYGGKSASEFAGGTAAYTTFKEGTLTADQKNGNYKITNPGKTTDGLTYKQPAWTQYKIGKTIADTTAYKDATFSVDKVGTRTREGDTWVHVVNQNTADTKADGWILLSNLTQTNALNEATQVKVNIVDLSGNTIKSFNYNVGTTAKGAVVDSNVLYDNNANATKFADAFQTAVDNAVKGTGYTVTGADSVNLNNNVKSGSTLTLYAKKGDQVTTPIKAYKDNGTAEASALIAKGSKAASTATDLSLVVALPTLTTPFSGVNGSNYTSADVQANLTTNKATTLSTDTLYLPADATIADASTATAAAKATNTTAFHVTYTFEKALPGSYSADKTNAASAIYTASLVKGAVSTDSSASNANNGLWGN